MELHRLALNRADQFHELAKYVAGECGELSAETVKRCHAAALLQPNDEPFDDVRDVVSCCTERIGARYKFNGTKCLSPNQSNIVPPEDD